MHSTHLTEATIRDHSFPFTDCFICPAWQSITRYGDIGVTSIHKSTIAFSMQTRLELKFWIITITNSETRFLCQEEALGYLGLRICIPCLRITPCLFGIPILPLVLY